MNIGCHHRHIPFYYKFRKKKFGVIQKAFSLGTGEGRVIEKRTKTNRGRGSNVCVRSLFLKKMLRFSKWSFIVILKFFLLIIMTVWNIKQTTMKDYVQSCQWMTCDRFCKPFLLCTTFSSFLCTVHYFLCAFSAKMATYSLVIDNVYFVISS